MEILLNPKRHSRPYPDERSREVMRKTIDFFEHKGKRRLKEDYHAHVWYADFLDFVKRERIFATMCTPAGYGARGRALGHLAHLRVRRDPRLLRPAVLVHLAGLRARPRPDLDERQRGGQAARRARARGRRHLRLRPLREGARRRHLLDRHGADAARRGRLRGQRAQVLHRQRQRGGDRLDLRQARRLRRLRLLRRRLAARALRAACRTSAPARTTSPSSRCTTTRSPRPTSCTRARDAWDAALNTVNIGKYNLGWASIGICTHALYEAIDARRTTGGSTSMRVTDFPHVKQHVRRRLRAPGRDEALRAARLRLHALAPRPRTAATCSTTRW